MKYKLEDIISFISVDYTIDGSTNDVLISKVSPIDQADCETLVWLNPNRSDKEDLLTNTNAVVIIVESTLEIVKPTGKIFIKVNNPKLVFLRIVRDFFSIKQDYGIHPTAFVDPLSNIHPESYIGPFTYIGKAIIGRGTVIKGNCHIGDDTKIGQNVSISAGTVIGSDGFGYARNEIGELEKFPHIGGVIIEDDVEIGANTCVDRGTLGNTRIKKGVKIDNLVHIAHNVIVGEDTAVIANSMLGGSSTIGNNTWISPSVCIRDGVSIGSNVTVGLAALVTKNIPDGEIWAGFPAKKFN
jgi:UDP-3-O-[3-hydroxymyristoyl] glucosamine N-acyltransferase